MPIATEHPPAFVQPMADGGVRINYPEGIFGVDSGKAGGRYTTLTAAAISAIQAHLDGNPPTDALAVRYRIEDKPDGGLSIRYSRPGGGGGFAIPVKGRDALYAYLSGLIDPLASARAWVDTFMEETGVELDDAKTEAVVQSIAALLAQRHTS